MIRRLIHIISSSRIATVGLTSMVNAIAIAFVLTTSFQVNAVYGWTVFLGIPVLTGFNTAILFSIGQKRSMDSILWLAFISLMLVAISLLVAAFEGLICIAMAIPIAVPLCLLGAFVGHAVAICVNYRWFKLTAAIILLVATPLFMGMEASLNPQVPASTVKTSIEIDCPVEKVWELIPEFSTITALPELIFKAGVAYPIRSRMVGTGVGARRYCDLSTGPMEEIVTAWQPPYHLAFDVLRTPPSMREISIYPDLRPPHLEGFYISKTGEFRLTPLLNGRTRVEGTSCYENRLWPEFYWLPISDYVVRHVHLRVLRHIKTLAEASATNANAPTLRNTNPHETHLLER